MCENRDNDLRRRQRGFTLIELLMVVAFVAIICSMAIPSWVEISRSYRLRSNVNQVAGIINANRMRGSSAFARVQVNCSGTTSCPGSSASCVVSLEHFLISTNPPTTPTWTQDSPSQTVCLSAGVSFALPPTSTGVGGQSTPSQNLTLYFNSLGIPTDSSGNLISTANPIAMYLTEGSGKHNMAIGFATNGRPTVYTLNNGTWVANQ
jgi:prepilin-type N-terminal cleavage/methylation domain-containing protein